MKEFKVHVSDENYVLVSKVKNDSEVMDILDNKIQELVNQGRQALRNEVADNYEKADPIKKAEFEALVEHVKAVEVAKLEEEILP